MKRYLRYLLIVALGLLLVGVGFSGGIFATTRFSSLFARLGGQAPRWDHLSQAVQFTMFQRSSSYRQEGKHLYENGCAHCHGPDGSGGRGPALNGASFGGFGGTMQLFSIVQNGIPGTEMPPSPQFTPRERLRVVAFVKSLQSKSTAAAGDVPSGREVYDKSGCATCHRIGSKGRVTGLNLAGVGGRRSAQHLRESLLNPGADVPDGYMLVRVVTRNGQSIRGARHYEDTFSVQFYDDQDQFRSFWKDEVQEFANLPGESPMPAYGNVLSKSQIDNLVAFLSSLR